MKRERKLAFDTAPRCGGRDMKASAEYPEQFSDFIADLFLAASAL